MPSDALKRAYLQQRQPAALSYLQSKMPGSSVAPNVNQYDFIEELGRGAHDIPAYFGHSLEAQHAARRGSIMVPHPYQEAGNVPEDYFNMMDDLPQEDIVWPSYEQELVVGGISEPMGQWPVEGRPVGAAPAQGGRVVDLGEDLPMPRQSVDLDELMRWEYDEPPAPFMPLLGGR